MIKIPYQQEEATELSWLTQVEAPMMMQFDPDLGGGFREVFVVDQVPVTVSLKDQVTIAAMKVRVLLLGDENNP